MILALVKNPILKARLDKILGDIVYFTSPIELLQNLSQDPEIAVIIENSGFEISGFIIVNVIDELVSDRKFNIYLITADYSKAFLYSKTFSNTVVVSAKDINDIGDLMIKEKSPNVKISYELFFSALDTIIFNEKIRTFIVKYSSLLLDNISDPNVWFDEYVEMLYSVTGIKKLILLVRYNRKTTVFSSVTNYSSMEKLKPFFEKTTNERFLILSNNNDTITDRDKFSSFKISSNGEHLGDMIVFIDKDFYLRHKLENIGDFILTPVKSFLWFYIFKLQKEENRFSKNVSGMVSKVLSSLETPSWKDIFEVQAKRTSYAVIPHKGDYYVVFSNATNDLNSILGMFVFTVLNTQGGNLEEIIKSINSLVHKNILTINPLPLGVAKISKPKVSFCATEGMVCAVEHQGSKKYYETRTGYSGTYDHIDVDIVEFELPKGSFLKIIPDAFYFSFAERSALLK